jgi:hypothetical protein
VLKSYTDRNKMWPYLPDKLEKEDRWLRKTSATALNPRQLKYSSDTWVDDSVDEMIWWLLKMTSFLTWQHFQIIAKYRWQIRRKKSMRKCSGNNTQDWGFDSIFDVKWPSCGNMVEFFRDEIDRKCPQCKESVQNDRKDYGCGQWCSPSSASHAWNICPKFKRSKDRFYGHHIWLPLYFCQIKHRSGNANGPVPHNTSSRCSDLNPIISFNTIMSL